MEGNRGGKRPGAGRPKGTSKYTTTLTICIDVDLLQKIDAIAKAKGIKRSQAARMAIENGIG